MKKNIIACFLGLTLSHLLFSQTNFEKSKLDHYFGTLGENNKFMGSVAVSKNGQLLYTNSIGFADVENNLKATEHSTYRIGSITKSFTTVLILKAVEQQKLDLNQAISKWFPTVKNAKKISVKQLLSHRSGIHNFTDDPGYLNWNTKEKTEKEMIDLISKGGSDFKPGTKASYSNSNFVLLTLILEKTYHKSYAELLKEIIVNPVGLNNTFVFGNLNPQNNACKSYSYSGNWNPELETHYTVPLGAGAINASPIDLTRFADALFGGKLLTTESLERMKTMEDGFGLGLFQIPFYDHIGYGHTGGIDGFRSVFAHFPEDSLSYALVANGVNMNINDISIAVLSAVFGNPYEIPVFTTYHMTSEELEQYVGVYASKQIPLKITVTKEGNTLIAQGTGQPSFSLEPTEKNKFKFEQAGAKFEFNPADNTMVLFQAGGQFKFTRE